MLELNWNIIWTFINVLVLYLLMKRFLFKPVTAIMQKRAALIAQQMQQAEAGNREAEALKQQYTAALEQANTERAEILRDAREKGRAEAERILQQAKQEAMRTAQSAEQALEQEKARAAEALRCEVADFAVAAAMKVAENMDEAASRKLVDRFITEAGAAQ